MLESGLEISVRKQAEILGIPRTKLYYKPIINDDTIVANLIREIYLSSDCRYGYRKIRASLNQKEKIISSKKVLKIMQVIGIEGLYPKKYVNTTIKNNDHKVYPYLLSGLEINKIDQVFSNRYYLYKNK